MHCTNAIQVCSQPNDIQNHYLGGRCSHRKYMVPFQAVYTHLVCIHTQQNVNRIVPYNYSITYSCIHILRMHMPSFQLSISLCIMYDFGMVSSYCKQSLFMCAIHTTYCLLMTLSFMYHYRENALCNVRMLFRVYY